MKRIVFLCHFSNAFVREKLPLKSLCSRNKVLKAFRHPSFQYHDFAIWVTDYIEEFKKHKDIEFHIVSPHKGLIENIYEFNNEGVFYHFYKCDGSLFYDTFNAKFKIEEHNNYKENRGRISQVIESISPDMIILCGAENPYYSLGVIDVKSKPIYVILQTFLNDSLRIRYNVSSEYRRKVEQLIFSHAKYFSTTSETAIKYIQSINEKAVILPSGFPTHLPRIVECKKDYDFMFFARSIAKNKGIEDYIDAIAIVAKRMVEVRCGVIGKCSVDYKAQLDDKIKTYGIEKNIEFLGFYDSVDDAYQNVARGRVLVLPSITAALNSTVREGMLMGFPIICYAHPAFERINSEEQCVITAVKSDINDLAGKMLDAINAPDMISSIGNNALRYAEQNFSNKTIVNRLLDNVSKIIELEGNETEINIRRENN